MSKNREKCKTDGTFILAGIRISPTIPSVRILFVNYFSSSQDNVRIRNKLSIKAGVSDTETEFDKYPGEWVRVLP